MRDAQLPAELPPWRHVFLHGRRRWLCSGEARAALRESLTDVRCRYPLSVDAWVLLPEHMHCIWTLPEGDHDFATRWRLLKSGVTQRLGAGGAFAGANTPHLGPASASRRRRGERELWQRRFWEHTVRDERDFASHCDYVHYNPVKHGLAAAPIDWPHSTFHRFAAEGVYAADWGGSAVRLPEGVGRE